MKNLILAVLMVVMIGVSGLQRVQAEDGKAPVVPHVELIDDATMKKILAATEPSEHMRVLSPMIGKWYYELKYWAKKDADPQLSSGLVDNQMMFGGRFLSSQLNLILNIGGQNIHYEGTNFIGYDAVKGVFVTALLDTMHTGIVIGEAQYDEEKKTLQEEGRFTHPLIGKEQDYLSELHFNSEDTYTRTIRITDSAGQEFKMLEIEFRRR